MTLIPITLTVACETCCGERCSSLECRVRGGTVELCGFPEFDGYVSTPPRFYLEKEIGGSIVICDYHSPGGKGPCWDDSCDNPVGTFVAAVRLGKNQCGSVPPSIQTFVEATITSIVEKPGDPSRALVNIFCQQTNTVSGVGTGLIYVNSTLIYFQFGSVNQTNVVYQANIGDDYVLTPGVDNFCAPDSATTGPANWTACLPIDSSTRYAYSGTATYNPAVDCDVLATDTLSRKTVDALQGCSPPTTGGLDQTTTTAFEPELSAYVQDSDLNSGSFRGQISNGNCASDRRATACDRYEQLQSEDTDEDAIARLLASPAGAWSAWQPTGDGTGGTCLALVCCRSAWEIRTFRTFEYKESEWRAAVTGQTPGAEVTFFIGVYRRAFGVGTYVLFQTLEYTATADGTGRAEVDGETPLAEGFETYVGCTYRAEEP